MQITRVVKKTGEDGEVLECTLMLSEEQTAFLVNFALGILIKEGTVSFFDLDPKEVDKGADSVEFLEGLDKDKMGKA